MKISGTARRVALILAATFAIAIAGGGSVSAASSNPNSTDYWLAQYPDAIACYKYENQGPSGINNDHLRLTRDLDGNQVILLKPFQASWPGDHWEVVIVKGGSVDYGFGPGNAVYEHPTAGVFYYPPLNAGGNLPGVSHVIVCKGEHPQPTPTPTPTPTPEPTPTPTPEPTPTPTPEVTPTPEPTPTPTPEVTPTPTPEVTPTPSPTPEPTVTPEPTPSPTTTPPAESPTPSVVPSASPSEPAPTLPPTDTVSTVATVAGLGILAWLIVGLAGVIAFVYVFRRISR